MRGAQPESIARTVSSTNAPSFTASQVFPLRMRYSFAKRPSEHDELEIHTHRRARTIGPLTGDEAYLHGFNDQ